MIASLYRASSRNKIWAIQASKSYFTSLYARFQVFLNKTGKEEQCDHGSSPRPHALVASSAAVQVIHKLCTNNENEVRKDSCASASWF